MAETWSEYFEQQQPQPSNAEFRADPTPKFTPEGDVSWKWKAREYMSKGFPMLAETIGSIAGGAAASPLLLESFGTAPVLAAGATGAAARQAAHGVNSLLGIPKTVDPTDTPMNAFTRSAMGEMGGQVLGHYVPMSAMTRTASMFPGAKTQAGRLWADSKAMGSETERALMSQEESSLLPIMQRAGIERMPATTAPNIRTRALATQRANMNPNVRATENALAEEAARKADALLERNIPSVNQKQVDNVRKTLTNYDDNALRIAETSAASRAETEAKRIMEATKAAESKLASLDTQMGSEVDTMRKNAVSRYGTDGAYDVQAHGADVERVARGTKAKVNEVFNKEYAAFDNPQAVADASDFNNAITSFSKDTTEMGNVLGSFGKEGGILEQRLQQIIESPEGAITKVLPESMPLAQWRGIKGDLQSAAITAQRNNQPRLYMELQRLARLAADGEQRAVAALGDDTAIAAYQNLSDAYRRVFVDSYRRGFVGTELLRGGGKEIGGSNLASADVMKKLTNLDNADSMLHALGSEQLAKEGGILTKLTPQEIQAKGKTEAKKLVEPYFQAEIAAIYNNAGGGQAGAKAIDKYLRNTDTQNILRKYGIEGESMLKKTREYLSQTKEVQQSNKMLKAVREKVVADTLKLEDPYKVSSYILNSSNPRDSLKRILAVSNDAEWRNSVQGLIKDDLKTKIDGGTDIFTDKRIREILPSLYNKSQLRSLRDYHTLAKQLSREKPGTKFEIGDSDSVAHMLHNAMSIAPVGMGVWYAVKSIVKSGFKYGAGAHERAVLEYIDDALINPHSARLLTEAYKGSPYAKAKLNSQINQLLKANSKMYENQARTVSNLTLAPMRVSEGEEEIPSEKWSDYLNQDPSSMSTPDLEQALKDKYGR